MPPGHLKFEAWKCYYMHIEAFICIESFPFRFVFRKKNNESRSRTTGDVVEAHKHERLSHQQPVVLTFL